MKHKNINLSILTLLFISIIMGAGCEKDLEQSINVFPSQEDSPQWKVLIEYSNIGQEDYVETYEYKNDTIFCGNTYIKVIAKSKGVERPLCYIRNEGKKVYLRKNNDCNEKEYLLYDFQLSDGESVKCGFHIFSPLIPKEINFFVKEINTINLLSGKTKKMLNMEYSYSDNDVFEMNWIEGIGSDKNPFYPVTISDYPGNGIQSLISFKIKGVELYSYPPN